MFLNSSALTQLSAIMDGWQDGTAPERVKLTVMRPGIIFETSPQVSYVQLTGVTDVRTVLKGMTSTCTCKVTWMDNLQFDNSALCLLLHHSSRLLSHPSRIKDSCLPSSFPCSHTTQYHISSVNRPNHAFRHHLYLTHTAPQSSSTSRTCAYCLPFLYFAERVYQYITVRHLFRTCS